MTVQLDQYPAQFSVDLPFLLLRRVVQVKWPTRQLVNQHKGNANFVSRVAAQPITMQARSWHFRPFEATESGTLAEEDLVGEVLREEGEVVSRNPCQPDGAISKVNW